MSEGQANSEELRLLLPRSTKKTETHVWKIAPMNQIILILPCCFFAASLLRPIVSVLTFSHY